MKPDMMIFYIGIGQYRAEILWENSYFHLICAGKFLLMNLWKYENQTIFSCPNFDISWSILLENILYASNITMSTVDKTAVLENKNDSNIKITRWPAPQNPNLKYRQMWPANLYMYIYGHTIQFSLRQSTRWKRAVQMKLMITIKTDYWE